MQGETNRLVQKVKVRTRILDGQPLKRGHTGRRAPFSAIPSFALPRMWNVLCVLNVIASYPNRMTEVRGATCQRNFGL